MEEDMTIMRKSPRRWDIPVPWAFIFVGFIRSFILQTSD